MPHFEYRIKVAEEEKRDIAIALLTDLGMSGFEETSSELIAISNAEISQEALNEVIEVLNLSYSKSVIEARNWNSIWESSFEPITVWTNESDKVFAYVRAHFHRPPIQALFDLVITPKMSFGTGHHATTYGMMSYMSRINFHGLSVVDFGTGTGVLAILADKMGAAKVLATDNDPWCIRNAGENLVVNGCNRIELKESDHFEKMERNDVILANINLNIIRENVSMIADASHANTIILLSGVLAKDERELLEALHQSDIIETDIIKNDEWLIVAGKSGRQIATLTAGS